MKKKGQKYRSRQGQEMVKKILPPPFHRSASIREMCEPGATEKTKITKRTHFGLSDLPANTGDSQQTVSNRHQKRTHFPVGRALPRRPIFRRARIARDENIPRPIKARLLPLGDPTQSDLIQVKNLIDEST